MFNKQELLKYPEIVDVTAHMEEPAGQINDASGFILNGVRQDGKSIHFLPCEYNFSKFFDINLIAGERLVDANEKHLSIRYVLNRSAVSFLGFETPGEAIGVPFKLAWEYDNYFYTGFISGVIEDFHLSSMEQEEQPLVLYHITDFNHSVSIKYREGKEKKVLMTISGIWKRMFPDFPLRTFFMEELYNKLYGDYIFQIRFLIILVFVVIFISVMGILGIVSFIVINKTKEIGVRKVNGAKVLEILQLVNKSFVLQTLIAIIFAIPISYWAFQQWVNQFHYKIVPHWWIFVLSGGSVLSIVVFIVSIKSYRVANKNPIEALRYE